MERAEARCFSFYSFIHKTITPGVWFITHFFVNLPIIADNKAFALRPGGIGKNGKGAIPE